MGTHSSWLLSFRVWMHVVTIQKAYLKNYATFCGNTVHDVTYFEVDGIFNVYKRLNIARTEFDFTIE